MTLNDAELSGVRMETVVNSHLVCKYTVIDGLCLDAFPKCMCEDRTTCLLVCRNLGLCIAEIRGVTNETLVDCIVDECADKCEVSAQESHIGCFVSVDKGSRKSFQTSFV